MKTGCGMRIGNGRDTRIQEEVWAGKKLVTFRERAYGNLAEKPIFVSDIMVGQRWDVNRIWNLFDRDSAQRMLSTYLPMEEKEDEIIWLQEENGDYSRKLKQLRFKVLEEAMEGANVSEMENFLLEVGP
ncbi:Clustered mitochondria protein-like protein [Bienertia sinuspersici]